MTKDGISGSLSWIDTARAWGAFVSLMFAIAGGSWKVRELKADHDATMAEIRASISEIRGAESNTGVRLNEFNTKLDVFGDSYRHMESLLSEYHARCEMQTTELDRRLNELAADVHRIQTTVNTVSIDIATLKGQHTTN